MAGLETLEKLHMLSVGEKALLTTGREGCREFAVPSKDGFWKFSVGRKRVVKVGEFDKLSLSLRSSIISRLL
jgi:hypothetical protein